MIKLGDFYKYNRFIFWNKFIMSQQNIPTRVRLVMTISAIFMPIFLILPFIFWGNSDNKIPITQIEIQKVRLAPVGKLVMGDDKEQDKPVVAAVFDPATVFKTVCSACHATGVLGAPKPTDKSSWQKRIADSGGVDKLIQTAIKGIGSMPPKGGTQLDDEKFGEVVKYILKQAEIK